jgi:hypothetical protein
LDSTLSYNLTSFVVVYNQENYNLELEKLRIELRHAQGMHAVAQTENIDASQKVMSLFLLSKTLLASLSLPFALHNKYIFFKEPPSLFHASSFLPFY